MGKMDKLRKLGIARSGSTAATYTNAQDRPTELMMDGVLDAEKDLVGGDSTPDKTPPTPPATPPQSAEAKPPENDSNNQPANKSGKNPFALWGLILAFFVPLVGLGLSIAGLAKTKKPNVGGKGLAIGGIIASLVVGFIQMILFILVIAALVSGTSPKLVEYRHPTHGYTVQHPKDWQKTTEDQDGGDSVFFKDEVGNAGKVRGQVEVVYMEKPGEGSIYTGDYLKIFKDAILKEGQNPTVDYYSEQPFKGNSSFRMIASYDGENGRVKAKTTLVKNSKDEIFVVSTQSPAENYDKLSETFDEIHASFSLY